jgi:NAD(P)-dependent dehydrogenase (short-subunit alcohol dehydrogenase family)
MRALVLALVALAWIGGEAAAQLVTGGSAGAQAAIARAVATLPRTPERIVVADRRDPSPLLRARSPGAEGFAKAGDRVVYLIEQGDTLQHACAHGGIFDHALAIVIWHEMAHAGGADEPTARKVEEDLWQRFVVQGRVDQKRGMMYLALLKARR